MNDEYSLLRIPTTPDLLSKTNFLTESDSKRCRKGYSWILDSCCTSRMTFDHSAFASYITNPPVSEEFGYESNAETIRTGNVILHVFVRGKSLKITLERVKHVPNLRFQLISISEMAGRGMWTTFDDRLSHIIRRKYEKLLSTGSLHKGLYFLDTFSRPEKPLSASIGRWHELVAHISTSGIRNMVKNNVVKDVSITNSSSKSFCIGCIMGKGHRSAILKASIHRNRKIIELVHSDVTSPIEIYSIGGARYVIAFIDDKSNWTVEYTMHRNSDSLNC